MGTTFLMLLDKIQPSQLYLSKRKLINVQKKIDPSKVESIGVIPIKKLGEDIIFTDGHTRAFAAYKAGFKEVFVEWETENLDWDMYEVCVKWCKDSGIFSIRDLEHRIISHKDYKILWYDRCEKLQNELVKKNIKNNSNIE